MNPAFSEPEPDCRPCEVIVSPAPELAHQNVSADQKPKTARKVCYKKLWKLLIDRDIKKKDLCTMAKISPASITKMRKNGHVSTKTIGNICLALKCSIGDVMELVPE